MELYARVKDNPDQFNTCEESQLQILHLQMRAIWISCDAHLKTTDSQTSHFYAGCTIRYIADPYRPSFRLMGS